jgi:hypothetical protein
MVLLVSSKQKQGFPEAQRNIMTAYCSLSTEIKSIPEGWQTAQFN